MKLRFLAAALMAAFLTACGGGSDPVVLVAPTTPATPATPNTNAGTSTMSDTGTPDVRKMTSAFGESYVVAKEKDAQLVAVESNVQDINNLIIYVKDYKGNYNHTYFLKDGNPTFNTQNNKSYEIANSGTSLSYTRFGLIDDDEAEFDVAFYQGDRTGIKDMPKTGFVTYKGHSIYQCKTCDGFKTGDATINVNFGSKSLTGTMAGIGAKGESGAILATITDNKFAGETADGTKTSGAFYGPQAAEIGGIFTNNKLGTLGAFGGKK